MQSPPVPKSFHMIFPIKTTWVFNRFNPTTLQQQLKLLYRFNPTILHQKLNFYTSSSQQSYIKLFTSLTYILQIYYTIKRELSSRIYKFSIIAQQHNYHMKFFTLSVLRQCLVNKTYKIRIMTEILELIIRKVGVIRSEKITHLFRKIFD